MMILKREASGNSDPGSGRRRRHGFAQEQHKKKAGHSDAANQGKRIQSGDSAG